MSQFQPLRLFARSTRTVRYAPCRQTFHFSTAPRSRNESQLPPTDELTSAAPDPSQKLAEATPLSSSETSRAADLAAAEARTDGDSAQAAAPKPVLPSDRSNPQSPHSPAPSSSSSSAHGTRTPRKPSSSRPSSSSSTDPTAKPTPSIVLSSPKYRVSRTPSRNLPVYTDYKRGGNLHLTTVRKITGDLSALRDELRVALDKRDGDVRVNVLTQHVVVKGHHKAQVEQFLAARGM